MFSSTRGGIECCACRLASGMFDSMYFDTYQEALDHLQAHRDAGHIVPDYAFEYLQEDMEAERPLEPMLCECGKPVSAVNLETGTSLCIECMLQEG